MIKYVIVAPYHHGMELNGKDIMFEKYLFLNVSGEHRIFKYTEEPTVETLMFNTKEEAKQYIKEYKLNSRYKVCTGNHFVDEVEFYEE